MHIREPWHKPVLLHLKDCNHFSPYEIVEKSYTDPELRPATTQELVLVDLHAADEHGREWRWIFVNSLQTSRSSRRHHMPSCITPR